tara:strand:- start:15284 stop:16195 length:912 start_codon:yes stop_codon:yes gene_type:complete
MKYLVTGGAGFIGSHLVDKLIEDNHVICVDDLSSGYLANLPKNKKLQIINKKFQDLNLSDFNNIDGIFHLASQVSVQKSIDDFYNSSCNNMTLTFKVWSLAKEYNIPVVYASSSAIYGNLEMGDELKNSYDVISPYALDKLCMEEYAKLYYELYKIPSIGLRFFNVYGNRQDSSSPYSGVISIFIDRLISEKPIYVNGGYQTRDFVHVEDIIKSLCYSMKNLHFNKICDQINVGTGKSISVNFLLNELIKILNKSPVIKYKELPIGDPEKSEGNFNKLEKVIGLKTSEFNSIEEGLIKTIDNL